MLEQIGSTIRTFFSILQDQVYSISNFNTPVLLRKVLIIVSYTLNQPKWFYAKSKFRFKSSSPRTEKGNYTQPISVQLIKIVSITFLRKIVF